MTPAIKSGWYQVPYSKKLNTEKLGKRWRDQRWRDHV